MNDPKKREVCAKVQSNLTAERYQLEKSTNRKIETFSLLAYKHDTKSF